MDGITESEMFEELSKLWGLDSSGQATQKVQVLQAIRSINKEGRIAVVSEICDITGYTRRVVTSVAGELISEGDAIRPPGSRGQYVATRKED